jgi:hypothetical protein
MILVRPTDYQREKCEQKESKVTKTAGRVGTGHGRRMMFAQKILCFLACLL